MNDPAPLVRITPPPPWMHLVPGDRSLAFLVDGSRLFAIDDELFSRLLHGDPSAATDLRREALHAAPPESPTDNLAPPAAISLNIAQACLSSADMDVVVITSKDQGRRRSVERYDGLTVVRLPRWFRWRNPLAQMVGDAIRQPESRWGSGQNGSVALMCAGSRSCVNR